MSFSSPGALNRNRKKKKKKKKKIFSLSSSHLGQRGPQRRHGLRVLPRPLVVGESRLGAEALVARHALEQDELFLLFVALGFALAAVVVAVAVAAAVASSFVLDLLPKGGRPRGSRGLLGSPPLRLGLGRRGALRRGGCGRGDGPLVHLADKRGEGADRLVKLLLRLVPLLFVVVLHEPADLAVRGGGWVVLVAPRKGLGGGEAGT